MLDKELRLRVERKKSRLDRDFFKIYAFTVLMASFYFAFRVLRVSSGLLAVKLFTASLPCPSLVSHS